eukprot:362196-Chlamydomonas_euryale.AAC.5
MVRTAAPRTRAAAASSRAAAGRPRVPTPVGRRAVGECILRMHSPGVDGSSPVAAGSSHWEACSTCLGAACPGGPLGAGRRRRLAAVAGRSPAGSHSLAAAGTSTGTVGGRLAAPLAAPRSCWRPPAAAVAWRPAARAAAAAAAAAARRPRRLPPSWSWPVERLNEVSKRRPRQHVRQAGGGGEHGHRPDQKACPGGWKACPGGWRACSGGWKGGDGVGYGVEG